MFQKIASAVEYPDWVQYDPRYRKLDMFDRLLDGTFYNSLPYGFYEEKAQGKPIKLTDRRPSAQYRLPRMIGRWSARKLFAGRHAPRMWHPDVKTRKRIMKIAQNAKLMEKMIEAVTLGSVGSIAITFRITEEEGKKISIALSVWRAKYCYPSFKNDGDLEKLRLCYITTGASLKALGAPGEINISKSYWFIRDYEEQREVTYQPVEKDDWNPIEGFKKEGQSLQEWEDEVYEHGLGFVPAQWFVNLSGGVAPDGACTWEDAIPNSIEIDYTLSQVGRGVRYNCAPQLVLKGDVVNEDGELKRGAAFYIHLAADKKDEDGNVLGGADAKLLEMNGQGTKVALELVHALRNMALEQISASRKDPEKIKGNLSGRAMEFLEEESDDLAMELRSQWGEHGMLPLLKKIIAATDKGIDTEPLALHWPRLNQPTPDEIAVLIPALAIAIDPLGAASQKIQPVKPKADGDVTPKEPTQPTKPIEPDPKFMLLTPEEARAYLVNLMDLGMLDIDLNEDEDDLDEDGAGAGNATAPEPEPIGGPTNFGEYTKITPPVTVNA